MVGGAWRSELLGVAARPVPACASSMRVEHVLGFFIPDVRSGESGKWPLFYSITNYCEGCIILALEHKLF